MKNIVKVLGMASLVVMAFVIGRISAPDSGSSRSGEAIQFVQAEKVRQSLVALRQVQTYLDKDCSLSAQKKVDEEIEISLMLLAEHVQAYPRGVLGTMLEARDPKLLEEVRRQKVDWNRTFTVPDCVPSKEFEDKE